MCTPSHLLNSRFDSTDLHQQILKFIMFQDFKPAEFSTFCISSGFALLSPTDILILILVLSRDSLPLSSASSTLGDTTAGDARSSSRSSISSAYWSNCENDSNAAMHPVRRQLVSVSVDSGGSAVVSALLLLCGILCSSNSVKWQLPKYHRDQLPNTAHSCSQHDMATATLTSKQPGTIMPFQKHFTLLGKHFECSIRISFSFTLILIYIVIHHINQLFLNYNTFHQDSPLFKLQWKLL